MIFEFNADPDPTFHSNADPDPDLVSRNNVDPNPQHCFRVPQSLANICLFCFRKFFFHLLFEKLEVGGGHVEFSSSVFLGEL
jgi:hypothetical protein